VPLEIVEELLDGVEEGRVLCREQHRDSKPTTSLEHAGRLVQPHVVKQNDDVATSHASVSTKGDNRFVEEVLE
jgi:hypothetical protein